MSNDTTKNCRSLSTSNDIYCAAVAIMNEDQERTRVAPATVQHLQCAVRALREISPLDAEALDARVRAFALQAISFGSPKPHLIARAALS